MITESFDFYTIIRGTNKHKPIRTVLVFYFESLILKFHLSIRCAIVGQIFSAYYHFPFLGHSAIQVFFSQGITKKVFIFRNLLLKICQGSDFSLINFPGFFQICECEI